RNSAGVCLSGGLMRGRDPSSIFLLPLALALAASAGCVANPNKAADTGEGGPIAAEGPTSLPPAALRLEDAGAVRRAPFSLTATDGVGLKLVSLTARGVVDEPLA